MKENANLVLCCLVSQYCSHTAVLRSSSYKARSATRSHPVQERNLAGRQDISEDPGTSEFESNDVQTRRISQQDL